MKNHLLLILYMLGACTLVTRANNREYLSLNKNWRFALLTDSDAYRPEWDDSHWRSLHLPHDWSIEGNFREEHPAGYGGGALPGGIGWYRKTFTLPSSAMGKQIQLIFDGIYQNSEVWINGHYLGKRPNGYITIRHDLSRYLYTDGKKNLIAVKVDNSRQPNSRWYSGSGIYRNVWLSITEPKALVPEELFIYTPRVSLEEAVVQLKIPVVNHTSQQANLRLTTKIYDPDGAEVAAVETPGRLINGKDSLFWKQDIAVQKPQLWSTEEPHLYRCVNLLYQEDELLDSISAKFGIRDFTFDPSKGFLLNGKQLKIQGVCNHHDLGALGAKVNISAIARQLTILKEMGCNAIRTAHNPPAPELLDLCDQMGFIVMVEAFDVWSKEKTTYGYHEDWPLWYKRDLTDLIKRDRNHPSVFIWSIGNEIPEQWDSVGTTITQELVSLVKKVDDTRPVTIGLNEPTPKNTLYQSGKLDLVGFNYHHQDFEKFPQDFPGQAFIGTETTSALQTRGYYEMPSDTVRRWPYKWDESFLDGNDDFTVSAYDHVSTPWGSTHEETWKLIKKHDFLSGLFVWTGFDYLGEPTPYIWPARSSYFGIVDLAGIPKDIYYMYQSEWTTTPVLHIFPHWNWKKGQLVDIWAYYNEADEAELFLNGKSQGVQKKYDDSLHVKWRLNFEPGTLTVITRKNGKTVLSREIRTSGGANRIELSAHKQNLSANGTDLSYITAVITDDNGSPVPDASHLISFTVDGPAKVIATDNGNPTDHQSFQSSERKAFHGKAIAIVEAQEQTGEIVITAKSDGLETSILRLVVE
ncbi:glycoside hydrolase family 2 protein [Olivibacter sp. SDN3]|uniref:beta-galactosidase GalB n=1 Tax=Olivibacter sp. SDN3 TaxID=2764720 RepID=UPI001650F624|nr:beta-galactosidase GalB [Olivibacter sp. SDN3]QNL49453.1 glycoside hydrolase family 2 protein [Olivibacter sp. SDN3]